MTHRFTGGSNMELSGGLYFPSQTIRFSGGSNPSDSQAMIIADTVEFTGSIVVDFDDVTTANPLRAQATLREESSGARYRSGQAVPIECDRFKSNRFET